ncbi:hypothetical protein ACF073_32295 [Streptomyces sp. NPDC015171]|uniref:hypothetical protein n=1 Tax=Streptomyces sp. NPDC015171 TaxID=3364945 RepID=UPI0036FDAE9D
MRETPDAGPRRIDLNVPQVAGSALAAVVAAKLASYFGVYGTILGAGVVSIVATCGGSLFQHFFKRTGEQLREKTGEAARPGGQGAPGPGEFTEGTVYRARVKSWRRPVVAAALVFGVTMAGITTYELVSGNSFSGGRGTTVSDAVTGHRSSSSPPEDPSPSDSAPPGSTAPDAPPGSSSPGDRDPSPAPSATPGGGTPSGDGGTGHGATPEPGGSAGTGPDGGSSASPAPAPSGPAGTATPREPSASSRSGTADPGQGGPAAP